MMYKKHTWKDIPGEAGVDAFLHNKQWLDVQNDQPIPDALAKFLDLFTAYGIDSLTITLHFTSSGYNVPMSMHGGPDGIGWPEEIGDERTLRKVTITADNPPLDGISRQTIYDRKTLDEIQDDYRYLVDKSYIYYDE
jgi:hypothetical protein